MQSLNNYITEAGNKPTMAQINFMSALRQYVEKAIPLSKDKESDYYKHYFKFTFGDNNNFDNIIENELLIPIDYLCIRFGLQDYTVMSCEYCSKDFTVLYDGSQKKAFRISYLSDSILKEWTSTITGYIKRM